jgi:N-acetylated-alpha-linked acidic dipeptidase
MVLRMADADVIPYQFTDLADTLHTYVTEVKKLAETERAKIKETNAEIADGTYKALADPKKTLVPPPVEPLPPYFNFAPLDQASDDLTTAAADFEKAFSAHAADAPAAVNTQLIQTERVFLDPAGLPKRPWYENMMYAPGLYTGYGVKTLPAVREAIEEKQWTDVDAEIARTAAAIEREAAVLKAATQTLNGAK